MNPYALAPPRHEVYNLAEPWARQPCDTDESYTLFSEYLRQGLDKRGRSLTRLVKGTATPLGLALQWAAAHAWDSRARLWDEHIAVLSLNATETTAAEMAKRHARDARAIQGLAGHEMIKLQGIAVRTDMPTLRPSEILRFFELGQMLERVALANTPAETEVADLSGLDLDDIKAMRRVYDKLAKKNPAVGLPGGAKDSGGS